MPSAAALPPEVEAAMDKRTSMGIVGDLQKYAQFQAASSMEAAAKNPGGAAAAGIGMGMGVAMASQMGRAMGEQSSAGAAGPPPLPRPGQASYYVAYDGQQAGPFDAARLRADSGSGRLTRDTLVWKQGMAQWTRAGDVAELQSLFEQLPPPLPKAN